MTEHRVAATALTAARVADIQARYEEWKGKGAEFVTPPIDRGAEIRCYLRDPDGYLIEVGQSTGYRWAFPVHHRLQLRRRPGPGLRPDDDTNEPGTTGRLC